MNAPTRAPTHAPTRAPLRAPIVVTRPDVPGRELTLQLAQAGADALWLPSFVIGAAPDAAAVQSTLRQLPSYDLAIFVSANAVRATQLALSALAPAPEVAWPAPVVIGAVGAATRARAAAAFAGAQIIAPAPAHEDDEAAGSESLWRALQDSAIVPRRAIILRAESGREWLCEQLRGAGAEVTSLAVYSRKVPELDEAQRRWLQERSSGAPPVLVVTSSEAVAALAQQMTVEPDVARWLRGGRALASHARIAERLRAAGYGSVAVVAPLAESIVAEIDV